MQKYPQTRRADSSGKVPNAVRETERSSLLEYWVVAKGEVVLSYFARECLVDA